MKITDILLYFVCVPVLPIEKGGIAPYLGSRDKTGASQAVSAIYKVLTDGGLVGWGEMNPIISAGFTKAILDEYLKPKLIGRDPTDINAIMQSFETDYNPDINTKHFASAIETALWDIMGKRLSCPVYKLLGGRVRDRIGIAYAMGIMSSRETAEKIEQVKSEGYKTIKTKGGSDVDFDIRRAHEMRKLCGSQIDIRVDMNQGYDLPRAVRYLQGVSDCGLEYVEQPLPANMLDDYKLLRERFNVSLAINEDCYIPGNFMRAIRLNAVDAAVVDLESSGGISEIIQIAHAAKLAGIPLAHHCAWDLGVKLAAILHVAAALPAFSLPADSTYMVHTGDILDFPLKAENGSYAVPDGPGLGVTVDEEKLSFYALADSKRTFVF